MLARFVVEEMKDDLEVELMEMLMPGEEEARRLSATSCDERLR